MSQSKEKLEGVAFDEDKVIDDFENENETADDSDYGIEYLDDDIEMDFLDDEIYLDNEADDLKDDKHKNQAEHLNEDDSMEHDLIDLNEDTSLNSFNGNTKFKKTLLIILGSIVGVILIAYIIGVVYFSSHFQFNTKINGTNFSKKTVSQVESYMKDHVKGYELTLLENTGSTEKIIGTDISLSYKPNNEVKKVLKKQNAFLWPKALFKKTSLKSNVKVDYDKQALTDVLNQLNCMKPENQTPPVNAKPVYNEATLSYDVVTEVLGTQINQEVFTKTVTTYISGFKKELDMQANHCYTEPKFTDKSPEVAAARDTMNTYVKGTVTYNLGGQSEAVTQAMIASWLGVGENMEVAFNTDAVNAYVAELNSKYSTVGTTRSITSPNGKVSQVSGGTFGWSIDEQGEATTLVSNIQTGHPVSREPIYSQTGRTHGGNDWGNTYVEVDLTSQYMWYVVNGSVVLETAVVTGKPTPELETPQGVYDILEIAPNQILKGNRMPDGTLEYETPVDYWMRVTWSGIGFHDANWQPTFGGDRYLNNGSHGCINMPPSVAGTFFDMLQMRDPVIIHY